jgi:hypothetical protein
MAALLLEKEKIDGQDIQRILGPGRASPEAAVGTTGPAGRSAVARMFIR